MNLFDDVFNSSIKCNIPIAPSEGLFLSSLEFNGYNKMVRDIEHKKNRVNRTECETKLGSDNVAGDDDNGLDMNSEIIDWHSDSNIQEDVTKFRDTILVPHIVQDTAESLPFLRYVDDIRMHPTTFIKIENNTT